MSQAMHAFMQYLSAFYQAHATAIMSIGGVTAVAMIHMMPAKIPTSAQELWAWVRDGLQTAIPARRADSTPNPTRPAPRDVTQGVWQPTPVITNGTFSIPTQPETPASTQP